MILEEYIAVFVISFGMSLVVSWLYRAILRERRGNDLEYLKERMEILEHRLKKFDMRDRSERAVEKKQEKAQSMQDVMQGLHAVMTSDLSKEEKLQMLAKHGVENLDGTLAIADKLVKVLKKLK